MLWFQDKVEILEYHSLFARSPSQSVQIPSVLRLKKFIKKRHTNRIRFCRENIYIRDDFTCQYCCEKFDKKDLTLDHVVPASKGGQRSWQNVVAACRSCNQKKANKTPAQAGMPLLTKPRQPKWLPEKGLSVHKSAMPENWAGYIRHLKKDLSA